MGIDTGLQAGVRSAGGDPFSSSALPLSSIERPFTSMSAKQNTRRERAVPTEPVGIVISQGSRFAPPPVFAAYEYGPAPEEEPAELLAATH